MLGLDDQLLREFEPLDARQRALAGGNVEQRVRALRYRAGEREAVREELFRRGFLAQKNPLTPVRSVEDEFLYADEFGMVQSSRGATLNYFARELIAYAHEEGTLAELKTRVEPLLVERPDDEALKAAVKEIERRLARDAGEDLTQRDVVERREKELAEARKRVEEDPHDPQRRVALARILLRSRQAAEALPHLDSAGPMVRGKAYAGLQERVVFRRQYGGVQGGVRFRFAVAVSRSIGTGYSSYGSSADSGQQEFLRLQAAARFATGDREGGLAAEERIARLGATSQGGWTYDPFTQRWTQGSATIPLYLELGLDAEVDRVAAAELEKIQRECAGDRRRELERRNALAEQILQGFAQRKDLPPDEARRERWLAERRLGWESHLAEAPDALDRELAYVRWLRDTAKDEEAWRARAEALVARPAWAERKPTAEDAWLYLQLGQSATARASFEGVAAARKQPLSRAVLDEVEVGLACCRQAEGEVSPDVQAVLRRYLAHGGSERMPAVRAALGLPPLP